MAIGLLVFSTFAAVLYPLVICALHATFSKSVEKKAEPPRKLELVKTLGIAVMLLMWPFFFCEVALLNMVLNRRQMILSIVLVIIFVIQVMLSTAFIYVLDDVFAEMLYDPSYGFGTDVVGGGRAANPHIVGRRQAGCPACKVALEYTPEPDGGVTRTRCGNCNELVTF